MLKYFYDKRVKYIFWRRKKKKTFKEIKIALKELFLESKIQWKSQEKIKLIQESKQKIEQNIIKNLKEWLKIISWDYLFPLKYLTTYNTIFDFNKKASKIYPWDILKLEQENLIIIRKNKKINIWKIIKKEKNKINDSETSSEWQKTEEVKKSVSQQGGFSPLQKKYWKKESDKYLPLSNLDDTNYNFNNIEKN